MASTNSRSLRMQNRICSSRAFKSISGGTEGRPLRSYTASNSGLMLAEQGIDQRAQLAQRMLGRYPVFKADVAEHGPLKALHTSHCKSPISARCRDAYDHTFRAGVGEFFYGLIIHQKKFYKNKNKLNTRSTFLVHY